MGFRSRYRQCCELFSGPLQFRAVDSDGTVEILKPARRLESELLHQQAAELLVRTQRLGLPPGSEQRQHQLAPEGLPQRKRRDRDPQLVNQRGVVTERQFGLASFFECRGPQTFQTRRFGLRELLVREFMQRRPTPQCERLTEQQGGRVRVRTRQSRARLRDQGGEAVRVESTIHMEHIAGRLGDERHVTAIREQRSQPVHVLGQGAGRMSGRLVTPQHVDETVGGHHLVGVYSQGREQPAELSTTDRNDTLVHDELNRSEHPHLAQSATPGRSSRAALSRRCRGSARHREAHTSQGGARPCRPRRTEKLANCRKSRVADDRV
jgi:hypothetical protein